METENKELKQALIRVQQDANAYTKGSEVLTERVTELEARLSEHGEILEVIPTMQRQIAYLKGRSENESRKQKKYFYFYMLGKAKKSSKEAWIKHFERGESAQKRLADALLWFS